MRIVHLSDLHFTARPGRLTAAFDKRLLGRLNYLLRRRGTLHEEWFDLAVPRIAALTPDCLVCSGDVTCVGSPAEFARARARLETLMQAVPVPLLYVPGNHDAYVADRDCRAALADTFRFLNGRRCRLEQMPFALRLGNVSFLMLNECTPTGPFSSAGQISPAAAEALTGWLSAPRPPAERRVLIGHYPTRGPDAAPLPRRRRLGSAGLIIEALAQGRLDLSLCGHLHSPYRLDGPGPGMEVCAGALTAAGSLSVVDIAGDGRLSQRFLDLRPA